MALAPNSGLEAAAIREQLERLQGGSHAASPQGLWHPSAATISAIARTSDSKQI